MKYLLIFSLFFQITGSFTAFAQTETKRPSWSQGLPERQSLNQPGKPGFIPDSKQVDTVDTPVVNTERPATPIMDIELSTQPNLDFEINAKSAVHEQSNVPTRRGLSHSQNRDFIEKEVNPLHAKYPWTLLKTKPIDIPARYATKDTLKVRIYINPNGHVIKVAAGAPDVPALMLKEAQQSIRDWLFEPPKNIGITDNLAKTFTIEIKTG